MTDNEDNIYKLNSQPSLTSNLRNELKNDLEQNMSKFNDPIVLGELLYKLLEERENSNRILKNILAKLDTISQLPHSSVSVSPHSTEAEHLLPEVDEKILAFVKVAGKATAEEVRAHFNYKGKNAACARLNRLFEMNLVEKKQVGKKVYFIPILR